MVEIPLETLSLKISKQAKKKGEENHIFAKMHLYDSTGHQ